MTSLSARPAGSVLGPGRFGGLLIITGLFALAVASIDHRRSMNSLRAEHGPQPYSAAAMIGIVIAAVGACALVSMSFGL